MTDYSFRLRFLFPDRVMLKWDEPSIELTNIEPAHPLRLHSTDNRKLITDSKDLVLDSSGWGTEEEATNKGQEIRASFIRSLARMNMSADFGFRNPVSRLTQSGIKWLEGQVNGRVLQDNLGLSIYTTDPPPRFAKLNTQGVSLTLHRSIENFKRLLSSSLGNIELLSPEEEISFGLYSSSFFAYTEDARFLNLMMAVEALLMPKPRSKIANDFVGQLIKQAKDNEKLSDSDKQSLIGSLTWLRKESISRTGRDLAKERLGNREYMGMRSDKFFVYCYALRSRLVHASDSLPSRDDISAAVADLEKFVAHLLSGSLIELDV